MIEVQDLHVRFGDVHAVRGVSFQVPGQTSFGLVGESGSGKSTVLRAICGLSDGWEGRITVDGVDLPNTKKSRGLEFYKLVQMVFQDPFGSLHPRHTIDSILSEPVEIHGLGDVDRRVLVALEQVGLDASYRFRFPHQLSGGQRQRVAVARTLILEPKIILLDEPTSALDVSIQAEVLNLLKTLQRELGLTYLMVSHDLPVIAHMCDSIAVMKKGEIVETLGVDKLSGRNPETEYAAQLILAGEGYDRKAVDSLMDLD